MDRLLTDEDHRHLLVQYGAEIDWPEQIAEAQDAKSIRVDRQAMANEMDSKCPHARKHRPKSSCTGCMLALKRNLRQGKMPGEET
ncbi:hypothetical protein LCGC14_0972080 [marine sediment metagenome]|uniref:Uncharacterized protein n=1 Tax=marine sediment metagenome TaxID=412755 RepID=A0A0F9RHT1_9ZZZZ